MFLRLTRYFYYKTFAQTLLCNNLFSIIAFDWDFKNLHAWENAYVFPF